MALAWRSPNFKRTPVSATAVIRIGTRQSHLALWQADYVRARLLGAHPHLTVEIVKMTTEGDRILDRSLATAGGKGLFTKELQTGLLEGRIDMAVHSMKDVTVTLPRGLHIRAICPREESRDAFVSARYRTLAQMPAGARVGTASLRRQSQVRALYPRLSVVELRGNVNTRLARLDAGDFDALVLASAGLKRLGFDARIAGLLDIEQHLPAVGQGAIGIECREDDTAVNAMLAALDDAATHNCVRAERALNARLQGGCTVPIGGYAQLHGDELRIQGFVGAVDGSRVLRAHARGPARNPEAVGAACAEDLLRQGAAKLLGR